MAMIKLSQFSVNPSKEHLDKALYIICYLIGIQDYCLVYDSSSNRGLHAYTDFDWAANTIKHHSITGYFVKLADGIISWNSQLQKMVVLSSTEAKYMALSDTCHHVSWIQNVFQELGFPIKCIPIAADNQGSIFIGSNPVQER